MILPGTRPGSMGGETERTGVGKGGPFLTFFEGDWSASESSVSLSDTTGFLGGVIWALI